MHEYMSATLIVSNIRLKNVHAMTCNKNGDSLVRKYAVSFSQKEKKKICCVSLGPSWDISIFETFLLCDSLMREKAVKISYFTDMPQF